MAHQSAEKYVLRFPPGMRDRVRKAAESNRRSMNGEIVYQLEQVLPVEETETAPGDEIGVLAPDTVEA